MSGGPLRVLAAATLLAALASAASAPRAHACGPDTPCDVVSGLGDRLGFYNIRRPQSASDGPVGAVIFLHGWRSSAAAVMRRDALRRLGDRLGVAIVAPEGAGATWSYPGSPSTRRDEARFFDALRLHLVEDQRIDPDRILITGFSMGASMAWFEACRAGDAYLAAAPMAGAFWDPIPERCDAPPALLWHLHGTADTVVPIEGRRIGDVYRQSDVNLSLAALRRSVAPDGDWRRDETTDAAGRACEIWRSEAATYRYCRHDGGHVWRAAWIEDAWRAAVAGGP